MIRPTWPIQSMSYNVCYKTMQPIQPQFLFAKQKLFCCTKLNFLISLQKKNSLITMHTCIRATIRIGREIECLPFRGLLIYLEYLVTFEPICAVYLVYIDHTQLY